MRPPADQDHRDHAARHELITDIQKVQAGVSPLEEDGERLGRCDETGPHQDDHPESMAERARFFRAQQIGEHVRQNERREKGEAEGGRLTAGLERPAVIGITSEK